MLPQDGVSFCAVLRTEWYAWYKNTCLHILCETSRLRIKNTIKSYLWNIRVGTLPAGHVIIYSVSVSSCRYLSGGTSRNMAHRSSSRCHSTTYHPCWGAERPATWRQTAAATQDSNNNLSQVRVNMIYTCHMYVSTWLTPVTCTCQHDLHLSQVHVNMTYTCHMYVSTWFTPVTGTCQHDL